MKSLGIAVAAGLLLSSTLSMAADTSSYPDMRGQWTTSVDHLVTGSGPH